jgi:histidinol-phosphate/aromatic aminotransferase/cobyric acid decarboxylase-like protein
MSGVAFLGPNRRPIAPDPTFPALASYAAANGIEVVKIPLTKTHEHDAEAMLARTDSDSSYESFLDHPLHDPRIIVARTFSKIYGLAGLRVGYSVSTKDIGTRFCAARAKRRDHPLGESAVFLHS